MEKPKILNITGDYLWFHVIFTIENQMKTNCFKYINTLECGIGLTSTGCQTYVVSFLLFPLF